VNAKNVRIESMNTSPIPAKFILLFVLSCMSNFSALPATELQIYTYAYHLGF
jgi:hypothetical protein